MARVTKDPEIRRRELIETAERLFLERGFDNTQVCDIVKELAVAQGTFYYYFKSKDEVLTAILEQKLDEYAGDMAKLVESPRMNALQKLQFVMAKFIRPGGGDQEWTVFFGKKPDPSTLGKFHHAMDEARTRKLGPVIGQIVGQGVEQGVFKGLTHWDDITEILFLGINACMHLHASQLSDLSFFNRKAGAIEELLENCLGIPRGSLNLSTKMY